jgi:hypothetical protein
MFWKSASEIHAFVKFDPTAIPKQVKAPKSVKMFDERRAELGEPNKSLFVAKLAKPTFKAMRPFVWCTHLCDRLKARWPLVVSSLFLEVMQTFLIGSSQVSKTLVRARPTPSVSRSTNSPMSLLKGDFCQGVVHSHLAWKNRIPAGRSFTGRCFSSNNLLFWTSANQRTHGQRGQF